MRSLVSYLIIASIFITGAGITESLGFRMYWYHPVYLLVLVYGFYVCKTINSRFLIVFLGITLYTLLTFQSGLVLIIKQFINLGVAFLTSYILIVNERHDINELFRKYVTFAKFVLVVGFIQVLMVHAGLVEVYRMMMPHLSNYSITEKLQSVLQEPSFVALTFSPILVFALHNIFYGTRYFLSRTWSYLFVVGYLLTISAIAYVVVLAVLLILYFKNFTYGKLYLVVVVFGFLSVMAYYTYQSIEDIQLRVDDTIEGLSSNFLEGDRHRKVNLSTFSFLVNYAVTLEGFKEHPISGHGLGTHELVYDRHTTPLIKEYKYYYMNRQDATGMAFRLLSETGIIGLSMFILFTVRYKVKPWSSFSREMDIMWVLNAGIFVFILVCLLRNGNYTTHGKLLFFMLYYLTARELTNWKKQQGALGPAAAQS